MKPFQYSVEHGVKREKSPITRRPCSGSKEYEVKKYLNDIKSSIESQFTSNDDNRASLLKTPPSQEHLENKLTTFLNSLIREDSSAIEWLQEACRVKTILLKKDNLGKLKMLIGQLDESQLYNLMCKLTLLKNLKEGLYFFATHTSPISKTTVAILELTAHSLAGITALIESECQSRDLLQKMHTSIPFNSLNQIEYKNRKAVQLFIYLQEKQCSHPTRPPLSFEPNSSYSKRASQRSNRNESQGQIVSDSKLRAS